MSEPTTDASTWGVIGAALAAAISGALGWLGGRRRRAAAENAEVAEQGVRAVEATAQSGVVSLLLARVEALEARVRALQHEQDAERRMRMQAEEHIAVLQRALIGAGLTLPEMPVFGGREPMVKP